MRFTKRLVSLIHPLIIVVSKIHLLSLARIVSPTNLLIDGAMKR